MELIPRSSHCEQSVCSLMQQLRLVSARHHQLCDVEPEVEGFCLQLTPANAVLFLQSKRIYG
jgi:hypothetical protein